MALFSNFCNICHQIDNESLKDISEVNMKHLNDILITFVGHADIINYNVIYLCHLCYEELTRIDKFREMCLSNLIQMRQRYINMKLELQDDDAKCVQNTLQQFVYEEVLRKSSPEKRNSAVSISTDCHGIMKCPEYENKDSLVFNRQVKHLQLATNECNINGACSEVSGINTVTECDESPVAVTNEDDIENEMLTRSENTGLEKFEGESDEDFDVSDANNDNKSNTSQIDFIKEEYDLQNERENSDSENFILKNDENESDEHANLDVKMPVVYNSAGSVSSGIEFTKKELNVKQQNSSSKGLALQTMENGFGDGLNVAFQIANVSTIVNMEEREQENIRSEDAKNGRNLRNRGSNSKLTAATINTQRNRPHVREYRNRRRPKTLQSRAHDRVLPSVESHTCTVCDKSFRTSSNLIRHVRTHDGNSYKYTGCNKTFTDPSTFIDRLHSGDRPYKCNVCNKAFMQSGNVARHERIHSGAMPYKCNVCNKAFTQSGNLARHERIHSGAMPYKCNVCNMAFTQSGNLARHERIHSGAMPYKCDVCNKAFTQSGNLTIHERKHNGDRPYKCTVCNNSFKCLSNLIRHKRIHSGDRSLKCTVCNKTFTDTSAFIKHKCIHSGERLHNCTVCHKTFKHSTSLSRHKRIHNGER